MNRKKNKNLKNKKLWAISGILILLVIIIAGILESSRVFDRRPNALPYIGVEEFSELLADNTNTGHFIYIGRPTCPVCRRYEPILRDILHDKNTSIHYFQTDLAMETDGDYAVDTLTLLQQLGVTSVPTLIYIENGVVIDIISNELGGRDARVATINFIENNGGFK